MSTTWPEHYKGRGKEYEQYFFKRYKPFLALLTARLMSWEKLPNVTRPVCLEIGAGTATSSCIIGRLFKEADLAIVDKDEQMLEMAVGRLAASGADLVKRTTLFHTDITDPKAVPDNFNPALVHSHGVLEHFNDETARAIVDRHRNWFQVHYIPGLYPKPSFGDERLLPLSHWVKALKPSRAYTFNDGLDYAMVFHPKGYH